MSPIKYEKLQRITKRIKELQKQTLRIKTITVFKNGAPFMYSDEGRILLKNGRTYIYLRPLNHKISSEHYSVEIQCVATST